MPLERGAGTIIPAECFLSLHSHCYFKLLREFVVRVSNVWLLKCTWWKSFRLKTNVFRDAFDAFEEKSRYNTGEHLRKRAVCSKPWEVQIIDLCFSLQCFLISTHFQVMKMITVIKMSLFRWELASILIYVIVLWLGRTKTTFYSFKYRYQERARASELTN